MNKVAMLHPLTDRVALLYDDVQRFYWIGAADLTALEELDVPWRFIMGYYEGMDQGINALIGMQQLCY